MASTAATAVKKDVPMFSSLSMSQDMVTVIIPDPTERPVAIFGVPATTLERKFVIHKEWICHYSPFFSSAFNGEFEEGKTQAMTLADVDPKLFAMVVHWIYCKEIKNDKNERPDLVACAKLWVLGDRFLMRKMQNDTMKEIHDEIYNYGIEKHGVTPLIEFCTIAVEFKTGDNPLFNIAVKKLASSKEEDFVPCAPVIPQSMLLKVTFALKKATCHASYYHKPEEVTWEKAVTKFFVAE